MTAILMCGELLLGTYPLGRPLGMIRFCVNCRISDTNIVTYGSVLTTTSYDVSNEAFRPSELIFKFVRQVGYNEFEYQLEHEMTNPKYSFSMYNHIEEFEEPNEKISMNKLIAKMRHNKKMKDLLVRYYRS